MNRVIPILIVTSLAILPRLVAQPTQQNAEETVISEPAHVLVMLERGFNRGEFETPAEILREAGHELTLTSPEIGMVRLNLNGEPHQGDQEATVALRDIHDIDHYDMLFIPGGYSPGYLEQDEDALRLVEAFMTADKPLAAICHGPRLLMATGQMEGRVGTMLWHVPSERANLWREGSRPAYLDQAVVRDGNLITSRYPNDVHAFGEAMVELLSGETVATTDTRPIVHMALWPGFDEEVVLGLRAVLESQGFRVIALSEKTGWIRGLNGFPVEAQATYADADPAAYVIAPGGVWPRPGKARQAEPFDWVEAQTEALESRAAWIKASWEAGSVLVLSGFDSYLLTTWGLEERPSVSASAQLEWAFIRHGLRWVRDPLSATAPNVWTISGADGVDELIRDVVSQWTASE